ncbi:hypothetical protein [Enterovirga sp.]|uniref:hypothetical protein n=1 Tax=Enterovirga sp. TaxID=2026350 RepID=UPI002BD7DE71|nr:hypothetical protein [Enterovirga sp.]HMO29445.1 hypothetical protein [Enterovirga sp.]
MRSLAVAAVLSLALVQSAAAEGVVACPAFKAAWQASLKRLALAPSGAAFGRAAGSEGEKVSGIRGVDATVICRDGALGHLELASAGDPQALEKASVSVLMAMDKSVSAEAAGTTAAGLRAESESMKKDAVSSWGPYELTWSVSASDGRARFTLDLAEN